MTNILKGDHFTNRYRITGTLVTASPLHIGTGVETDQIIKNETERKQYQDRIGKVPAVATVQRDHRQKPLIPGSSLRGAMRHWLLNVLQSVDSTWADVRDYETDELLDMNQAEQINTIKNDFSRLELLFGTPFNAGKLEIWDAKCVTDDVQASDAMLNWDRQRLTYVDTSVAIDPATGTAKDKLLYKTEIVPPGVEFEANLVAQNLSDEELGLTLFALQGFNSEIYPIRLGARAGRGYGRMRFTPTKISYLDRESLGGWIKGTLNAISFDNADTAEVNAGYFALPELNDEQQRAKIAAVKKALTARLGS